MTSFSSCLFWAFKLYVANSCCIKTFFYSNRLRSNSSVLFFQAFHLPAAISFHIRRNYWRWFASGFHAHAKILLKTQASGHTNNFLLHGHTFEGKRQQCKGRGNCSNFNATFKYWLHNMWTVHFRGASENAQVVISWPSRPALMLSSALCEGLLFPSQLNDTSTFPAMFCCHVK